MGRSADGGSSFSQARNFGTFRLPGNRSVSGFINPGERTDWFRIDVANRKLRSGTFGYSAGGSLTEVQAQVNLFFRPGNRGGLQRVESFPAVSDGASVEFDIRGSGSFYIQISARPISDDLFYSLNFSASESSETGQTEASDLFN